MKKYKCEICKDTGRVEVDPFYPECACTPQYDVCECIIKEAEKEHKRLTKKTNQL